METPPIAYAIKRRHGPHRVLCPACCGGIAPDLALEVRTNDRHRATHGVPTDGARVIVCHACGERLDVAAVQA